MVLSTADAAHLLRRSGFGVSQAKLDELTRLASRNAAIDRVLDLTLNPAVDPPVGTDYVEDQYDVWWKMSAWWLERMRTSPTPIVEKLMLFWHNHFPSAVDKVEMGLLVKQHLTMRQHATGSFHSLAQAMAIDPAMLWYLDNLLNSATRPQENFGRELMELFTLGTGNYTQTDVVSMTRAWTGHSVDDSLRNYQFRSAWHDNGKKTLFRLASRNWDGPAALTEILRGSKAVASSRFLTAKMFSYFAYPIAVTDPIVASIATTFRSSGLNIMTLVREIFRSAAFWSPAARRAQVRSPIEWCVASLQATGLTAAQVPPQTIMAQVGHTLFLPPDVSGWKGNDYWLTTAGMWGRSYWSTYVRYHAWQGGVFGDLHWASPADIATAGFARFGITEPSPVTRAAIEEWAAAAQSSGQHWSIPLNLVQLLLLSPDFMVA